MRTIEKRMLGALTAVLFLFCACGDDPAAPVDTAAGDLDAPTLDEDVTATDDLVPDVDTAAPTKPGDDFNTPERNLMFEFKGLINTYDDVLAKTDTGGVMDLTLSLGDITITMNDYPTAYRLVYPEDEEQYGELAGTEHIILGAHGDLKQEGAEVMYYTFVTGIPVVMLEEIKKNGTPDTTAAGLEAKGNLTHTTYLRRPDNSVVLRRCMIALLDDPEGSRFFVNFANNTDFTPGENLLIWGNLALATGFDPTELDGYEQYEGQWCTFRVDDTTITKAQYEEELVKDVTKLDCEMPEGFLDGAGDTSLTYTFRGLINEEGSQDDAGFGTFTVKIAGETVEASDYIAMAQTTAGEGEVDLVTIESAGGLEIISGQNYYGYNYLIVLVDKQTLLDAKEAGDASCLFSGIGDGATAFVELFAVEEKQVGGAIYQKVCPTAVLAPLPATSALFYCIGGNTEFAVGEQIQSAGNVTLTTDEAYMVEVFEVSSTAELCTCSQDYTSLIDCADFDAVEP